MLLTNLVYKDGFGENFKYIIYIMFYTELTNNTFHYTPLNEKIHHNYNNDPSFINKKEKLINLINHFENADEKNEYYTLGKFDLIHFFQVNTDLYLKSKTCLKLKTIFREVNVNRFDKTFFNVAIHIRRLNPADKNILPLRRTIIPGTEISTDIYKNIIKDIKNKYTNCKFHIYSQGDEKDFDFEDDIILHLNESIEDTFTDFVYADLLVVAPSSFSYSAALISDGIIYYISSYHKPLSTWNLITTYRNKEYEKYKCDVRTRKYDIYFDPINNNFYIEPIKNVREYIDIHKYLNIPS